MKLKICSILILLLWISKVQGQDNCSSFYPMVEGATFTYTLYDKKDKVNGTSNYKVQEVSNYEGNTKASLNILYQGSKKNETFEMDYNFTCTGEGIRIDFNSLMPTQMLQQYKDMDVEMDITGTDIELPNTLNVGQELKDADINIAMSMSGIQMAIEAKTTNRKVVAKESVTTTAGTFDCVVLTSDINSKAMMVKVSMSDKLWLAQGVGIVKQETYNKKGKLESRMELTAFSK